MSYIGANAQGIIANIDGGKVENVTELSVSANSTTNLVTITQTGTGNALVVEDSTNPDSTPFVVNASGDVGVGTDSVTVVSGSKAVDIVGQYSAYCRVKRTSATTSEGGVWAGFGSINVGSSVVGGGVLSLVTENTERMRIDSSGNVGIGTTPSQKLEVLVNETTGSKIYTSLSGTFNKFTNFNIDCSEDFDDSRAVLSFYHDGTQSASITTNYRTSDGAADYLQIRTYETDQDITLVATGEIIATTAGTQRMRIDSSGNVKINNLGTGTVYSSSGTLTNTNPSDANLKENIVDINYGLAAVKQLRPVEFDWIADEVDKHELGFIAQEVQPIIPDLVNTYERYNDETQETETGYGLESVQFIAVLTKAIQEQQVLIESQQAEITSLQTTVADLLARVEALEAV